MNLENCIDSTLEVDNDELRNISLNKKSDIKSSFDFMLQVVQMI